MAGRERDGKVTRRSLLGWLGKGCVLSLGAAALALGIDGSTLPLEHGFPLRLVVPRLWAYKQAKYVHHIELTDHPVESYWVKAGSSYEGEVPPELLRPGKY